MLDHMQRQTSEDRFADNYASFLNGTPRSNEPDLECGNANRVEFILAEIDRLFQSDDGVQEPAITADDEPDVILETVPAPYVSPYDRIVHSRIELESALDAAPSEEAKAELQAQVDDLIKKGQAELKREEGEEYRRNRSVDRWRAEHHDEYNAKRRIRPEPNLSLADLTTEERRVRLNAQKKKSHDRRFASEEDRKRYERERKALQRAKAVQA
jgi:hypothetical protein